MNINFNFLKFTNKEIIIEAINLHLTASKAIFWPKIYTWLRALLLYNKKRRMYMKLDVEIEQIIYTVRKKKARVYQHFCLFKIK